MQLQPHTPTSRLSADETASQNESKAKASSRVIDARERLILALDFPLDPSNPDRLIEVADARQIVETLGDLVEIVKVGWPLYMAGGIELVRMLRRDYGKKVFLDLKFGDISETVRRLVMVAVKEDVSFLTVNTSFQAVRAAVKAKDTAQLKVLTVTLLTSLNEDDLKELEITCSVDQYVLLKARRAKESGCDGIVASGREAAAVRKEAGDDFLIVTPGIRPRGVEVDDHKRSCTPDEAIRAGADYLVVGRPITKDHEPRDTTRRVLDEMQRAFDSRR